MHFRDIASTTTFVALAFTSFVSAAPVEKRNDIWYGNGRGDHVSSYLANAMAPAATNGAPAYTPSSAPSWQPAVSSSAPPAPSYSYSSTPAPAASASSGNPGGSSNPVVFPLANGFPNVQNPSQALTNIQIAAHGTLPNGAPPPSLAADDLTSLRLIAFNELFEVFYFTELLNNITNNAAGYQFQDEGLRQKVINEITAVIAQEELHALNANGALAHFNAGPIQACKYVAPVADFKSAIGLASTFTDVVLGTLQDVIVGLGINGDAALSRGVASVIGQEGEQNGFYRDLLGKLPSALPFLTASSGAFAYSALVQNFIVPGSCPNQNTINIPIFGTLNVLTQNIQAASQELQFSFDGTSQHINSASGLSLVYINQQNTPIVEQITGVNVQGSTVTFNAYFPYNYNEMNGLTIAAVVKGSGPFADVDAVAKAALFGPGLIEIN